MFTSQEKRILYTLTLLNFSHVIDFMILMPLGAQLMRLFNITPSEFSHLVSAYTLSAGVFGFLCSFFIDRFPRKKFLLFLYFGFMIGTFACAFANSYLTLLIARCATGAFGGVLYGLILSLVADVVPLEKRASAMGIVMIGFSLASVIGVPFGLFIAAHFSWHAPFLLLALTAFLLLLLIYFFIPELKKPEHQVSPLVFIRNTVQDSNQILALLSVFALTFGHFIIIPFISPYMVSNIGFQEIQLSYIYFIGGAFTLFTSPLIGIYADKHGKHRTFSQVIFAYFISVLILTNLAHIPIAVALISTSLFFIFSHGRNLVGMSIITSSVTSEHRGGFMSLNSCLQQIAAGSAAYASGMIVTRASTGELLHFSRAGMFAILCNFVAFSVVRKIKLVKEPVI
jgi:multidrug resistance protein